MLHVDNPFWTFTLKVYAQPGVSAECIALQDTLGIDVNVLLFCVWFGAERQRVLDDAQLAAIEAEGTRWQAIVIKPLRAIRQAMKPMPEMAEEAVAALRKDVAAAELRSEQIEQALLFAAAERLNDAAKPATAAEAVAANVVALLRRHSGSAADLSPRQLIAAAIALR